VRDDWKQEVNIYFLGSNTDKQTQFNAAIEDGKHNRTSGYHAHKYNEQCPESKTVFALEIYDQERDRNVPTVTKDECWFYLQPEDVDG
jgi:hypothetical protein